MAKIKSKEILTRKLLLSITQIFMIGIYPSSQNNTKNKSKSLPICLKNSKKKLITS